MAQVIEALFSLQFVLFCLGVSAIVEIFRRLVDFFILDNPNIKANRTSKFWRSVVLPSAPVIIGLIITLFATEYPYPEMLTSKSSQLIFGLVGGGFSTLAYKAVRAFFKKFIRKQNNKSTDCE